ncbi:MAG: 1,2-phenylacetyl-CoA epoxidase subunit PaaD [Pseudomonadota bacterium]
MAAAAARDTAQIWQWLEEVTDPEIPVLSVLDLGLVRDVRWQRGTAGEELVVTVTPTYSGCPAMDVIAQSIEQALRDHGIERLRLETRLSPAWTTDWLTEKGRSRLREFGIAPPAGPAAPRVVDISGLRRRRPEHGIACPRCGSADTALLSRFGSTACKAQYRCNACLEPFDYFKSH